MMAQADRDDQAVVLSNAKVYWPHERASLLIMRSTFKTAC